MTTDLSKLCYFPAHLPILNPAQHLDSSVCFLEQTKNKFWGWEALESFIEKRRTNILS